MEALSLTSNQLQSPSFELAQSWIYIDLAKKALAENSIIEAKDYLNLLLCPAVEHAPNACQQIYWVIIKLAWNKDIAIEYKQQVMRKIMFYPNPEDPKLTLALIKTAISIQSGWASFLPFLMWAGIGNITNVDILEPLISPVGKALTNNVEIFRSFVFFQYFEWLEQIAATFPRLVFANYYATKTSLLLGDVDQAKKYAVLVVKEKNRDFWAWQLLANCCSSPDERINLLAKGISLGGKEEMLVGIRQELALALIENEMWAEAKFEIRIIEEVRKKNSWRMPSALVLKQACTEYVQAVPQRLNFGYYSNQALKSLFAECPGSEIVICRVDEPNQMAYYVNKTGIGGKFCYKKLGFTTIKVGEKMVAKLEKHPTKEYEQVRFVEKSLEEFSWVKQFDGRLLITNQGNGFVNEVYIPHKILAIQKLKTGVDVKGISIRTFDPKHNKYGWKAISVGMLLY